MVVYTYKCNQCGHEFDKAENIQKSPPKHRCPLCKGKTRKLINVPSIHFHGPGFTLSKDK